MFSGSNIGIFKGLLYNARELIFKCKRLKTQSIPLSHDNSQKFVK